MSPKCVKSSCQDGGQSSGRVSVAERKQAECLNYTSQETSSSQRSNDLSERVYFHPALHLLPHRSCLSRNKEILAILISSQIFIDEFGTQDLFDTKQKCLKGNKVSYTVQWPGCGVCLHARVFVQESFQCINLLTVRWFLSLFLVIINAHALPLSLFLYSVSFIYLVYTHTGV